MASSWMHPSKDAKQAMGIAAALGFSSLTEALQKLEVYHKPAGGECSVVKLRDEFLKHYTGNHDDGVFSSRTLSSYRSKTDPLRKQFGTMQIRELNGPAVWTELKRLSRTRGWGGGPWLRTYPFGRFSFPMRRRRSGSWNLLFQVDASALRNRTSDQAWRTPASGHIVCFRRLNSSENCLGDEG